MDRLTWSDKGQWGHGIRSELVFGWGDALFVPDQGTGQAKSILHLTMNVRVLSRRDEL